MPGPYELNTTVVVETKTAIRGPLGPNDTWTPAEHPTYAGVYKLSAAEVLAMGRRTTKPLYRVSFRGEPPYDYATTRFRQTLPNGKERLLIPLGDPECTGRRSYWTKLVCEDVLGLISPAE